MNANMLTARWDRLPENAVRQLQADKLRHYLRDIVLPFSARYRELFKEQGLTADSFSTIDDLQKLPFTQKADLLNTPDRPERVKDFVLIPDQKTLARRPSTIMRALLHGREYVKRGFEYEFRPVFLTSTTGRSADPIPFLYTQYDLKNLAITGRRVYEVCGAEREYRLLNMFPYAPHLAFWLTHYGGTEFGVFVLSSGGGKVTGTDGQLRMLRKIKPNVLIGMPTFVYHVLQHAVEEGVKCRNLCRIVLGGEKVPPGLRHKLIALAQELGARQVDVVTTYGFTEAKTAWAECPSPSCENPSGYHLYPDMGIVEVVDPKTGAPVPTGHPGEIVFTPIDSRGTAVLRYRTGDCIDGGLFYGACPHCGRMAPRLMGNISRNSEVKEMQLDKLKGTLVDFNELEHVLDNAAHVGGWQLEIRKRHDDPLEVDELVLHVQKLDNYDGEKLTRELQNRFVAQAEVHLNRITFHEAGEMRRLLGIGEQLKELKIVDNRPKAGHPSGLPVAVDKALESPNGHDHPALKEEVAT